MTRKRLTAITLALTLALLVVGMGRTWRTADTVDAHGGAGPIWVGHRIHSNLTLYGGVPRLVDLGSYYDRDQAFLRLTHPGNAPSSSFVTLWDPDVQACSGNINRTGTSVLNITRHGHAENSLAFIGLDYADRVCMYAPVSVTNLILDLEGVQ